jgi:hypothetical protein
MANAIEKREYCLEIIILNSHTFFNNKKLMASTIVSIKKMASTWMTNFVTFTGVVIMALQKSTNARLALHGTT